MLVCSRLSIPIGRAPLNKRALQTVCSDRSHESLRVAIIGSGPAGFYAAHRLQQKIQNVKIDMFEQLPTPFGLVRFGVAPDHPEVKNCIDTFTKVAEHKSFNFVGNTSIGGSHNVGSNSIPLDVLSKHYYALLFAYGASHDRSLKIPREDLPGIYSARSFVGWYNNLPSHSEDEFPELTSSEEAVIIGQGNVALDVARILLSPISKLKKTDISSKALHVLDKSRIKRVRVVGRRGPLQAAYTTKELRELMQLGEDGVIFDGVPTNRLPDNVKSLPRVLRRSIEVLQKGSTISSDYHSTRKSWSLDYYLGPTTFNADKGHLSSITLQPTSPSSELPLNPSIDDYRNIRVQTCQNSSPITFQTTLAFKSIGYKSNPLPGLSDLNIPFDETLGIIPNDASGRVMNPNLGPGGLSAGHVAGCYAAGWVKRGPTGVIASTMDDAFMTADAMVKDWEEGVPFFENDRLHKTLIPNNGRGRSVSWEDWKRLDAEEVRRGKDLGKEREKFSTVKDMLNFLDASHVI